jgi:hypothetical protein
MKRYMRYDNTEEKQKQNIPLLAYDDCIGLARDKDEALKTIQVFYTNKIINL